MKKSCLYFDKKNASFLVHYKGLTLKITHKADLWNVPKHSLLSVTLRTTDS